MLQIRKMVRASFDRLRMSGQGDAPSPARGEGAMRQGRDERRNAVAQRANRAAAALGRSGDTLRSFDTLRMSGGVGAGGEGWARPEYGRYMATSPSVYAAVRLRAEAVTRPPLRVYRVEALRQAQGEREYAAQGEPQRSAHGEPQRSAQGEPQRSAHGEPQRSAHGEPQRSAHGEPQRSAHGELVEPRAKGERRVPVEASHPVARLLERVNPWYTRADLWRATEIYLCLWGSAFWAIQRGEDGEPELWPLRPDRMAVIPDRQRYVRGFVYRGSGYGASSSSMPSENVAYTPDEIVWLRYFNPLDELAGLSPLAPARLSADMGHEGLRFNRHLLRNSARPDFLLLTNHELNDAELEDFYQRWEQRYQGPGNAHRPAVASAVRDVKTLGLSHRDIDFIQGLRWSLEEVSRAYGVPKLLLGDFERATYANVQASERMFWRNTVVPEVRFLEDQMNRALLPRLGYPNLAVEFDLSVIEALQEDEASRVQRETALLDRGVLTINEVRRERNLPEVPWGDGAGSSS